MARFFLWIAVWFLSACSFQGNWEQALDNLSFQYFGITLFSTPSQVTMKEIHLDKGLLVGHEVVVAGRVQDVGSYNTFVVLSDKTARMLVVLTDVIVNKSQMQLDLNNQEISVFGTVDYGRRGLPYVHARSVTYGAQPAADKVI